MRHTRPPARHTRRETTDARSTSTAAKPRRSPAAATHVVETLWPPQPGTQKLLREHGGALLCVRYRRDASGLMRQTTIELVVETRYVNSAQAEQRIVELRLHPFAEELRAKLIAHGARWNPSTRTWFVMGSIVKKLDLLRWAFAVPSNGERGAAAGPRQGKR